MFSGQERALSRWMFHTSLGRAYLLLPLDEVVHRSPFHPVDGWCSRIRLCSYWFPACQVCLFLKDGCRSLQREWGVCWFSLGLSQFLPHLFWHSVVRCVHVKGHYVFLGSWALYRSVSSSFSPIKTFLALKSAVSEINVATTFLISVSIIYFSPCFYFNLYVSLYL